MAADRPAVRALLAASVLAAAVLLAGCGGTSGTGSGRGDAASPARPISSQNPISLIPRATPAEYRAPMAAYKRYVARRLAVADRDVTALRRALAHHDLAAARRAWRAANATYQSIGAAYGAFGDLDAEVNASIAGLPRGVHDPDFTGLHRVELALYERRSIRDAVAPARALESSVRKMRRALPKLEIDPLEYSLRAHEILEDTLDLQLTGIANPWSGAAYDGAAANVAGAREVLRTLIPMLDARARARRVEAQRALGRAANGLARLRRPDGTYPTLTEVAPATRRRMAALLGGTAETLSYVPEVIDPRPPRPVRSPYAEVR